MKRIWSLSCLGICSVVLSGAAAELSTAAYETRLQEAKNRPRPAIFNNDGGDAYLYPAALPFSVENFLKQRTALLPASSVSTISYCTITSSFGQFTHPTRYGEFLDLRHQRPGRKNVVADFVRQGTDPLREMISFARRNRMEIFWCNRMNDCHDFSHRENKPYERYSQLKQNHPDWLCGAIGEKLPHGVWSAVDYRRPEIRQLVVRYFVEVAENYEIDGIEMDFFRHFHLFGDVARGAVADAAERDMLLDMFRSLRRELNAIGRRRGRPILLAVRVPDSPAYCRAAGLDWEAILQEQLVDLVIGSGYFQLEPWSKLVALARRHGVKVYASLSESRIRDQHPLLNRAANPVWRARAAAALKAGVDGIHIFNQFDLSRAKAAYAYELREPARLFRGNKLYCVTYLDGKPESYLKDGARYRSLPLVTPRHPGRGRDELVLALECGETQAPRRLLIFVQGEALERAQIFLNRTPARYLRQVDDVAVFEADPAGMDFSRNEIAIRRGGAFAVRDCGLLAIHDPADPDLKKIFNLLKEQNEKK